MKTIYYISGLGADERVFAFLNVKNVIEKHIHWISPEKKENLQDYCKRLIQQIDLSKPVILVGVSFGGIIAQEIAKQISVEKIIIISSVKNPSEFSFQLKMIRFFKFYKILQFVPNKHMVWSNLLTANYFFSIQNKSEASLLKKIIEDTDMTFSKWAIDKIMTWENTNPPSSIIHIHGTKDRIFPFKNIKNSLIIQGSGHFMIVNKADEITQLIENEL